MSTETTSKRWPGGTYGPMLAELGRHPGEQVTITLDQVTVGMGLRRQVRAALNRARIRGAQVEVMEEKGWFESVFAVRMNGAVEDLEPTMRILNAMAEASL